MSTPLFLRMIQCPRFSIQMLLTMLISETDKERRRLLLKRIFYYDFKIVDFYLPQIACILLSWDYDSIKFLLFYLEMRCTLCPRYVFDVNWIIQALYPINRVPDILNHLVDHSSLFVTPNHSYRRRRSKSESDKKKPTFFYNFNGEKVIHDEKQFASHLMSIEEGMIPIKEQSGRIRYLIKKLDEINSNIKSSLKIWNPLVNKPHSIINIPTRECNVLKSAKRAPYFILMECVEDTCNDSKRSVNGKLRRWNSLISLDRELKSKIVLQDDDSEYVYIPNVPDLDSEYDIVSYSELTLMRIVSENKELDCLHNPIEEVRNPLPELWKRKIQRISKKSEYGRRDGWFLSGCIVKYAEDIRHELVAYQFIAQLKAIWKMENVSAYVYPVKTILLNKRFALMEPIPDVLSLHDIKCRFNSTLYNYMSRKHRCFLQAQENFVSSCAGYSVVCYLLQVRDRHNGNILMTDDGRLIHIDFGFILDSSPGNIAFEQADFKITNEYVEVMGGYNSDMFIYYKMLMVKALIAARKHKESLISIIRSYQQYCDLKCCSSKTVADRLDKRFLSHLQEVEILKFVETMVDNNLKSLTTRVYDFYQLRSCGIR